jgi:Domain of unknown function (DUF6429)
VSSALSCYPHDAMDIDENRIDDAVLALLLLGLHDARRAWKSFDWDALDRLHAKGLISDPVGKTKSVIFTDEGLERARALFQEMFASSPASPEP